MKEKVVFDTNKIKNSDVNYFLGNRIELEKFKIVSDIIIPEPVILETVRQKRSKFHSSRDKFIANPVHSIVGLIEEDTRKIDIDNYIKDLRASETIPFETIDLKNYDILPQIRDLAFNKRAPFENKNESEKGFRDAIIYFSILEYLDEIPDKKIFVCTEDKRFTEALNRHHNIIVIKSFEDFKDQSITQFSDPYFIEKLNKELTPEIVKTNIIEFWYNIVDNQVLLIEVDYEKFVVEIDSGEIINSVEVSKYEENIVKLINSNSFRNTHRIISKLSPFINYLSDEEINAILEASINNEEIRRIINDQDVKEFIGELFDSKKEILNKEIFKHLDEILS